MYHFKAIGFDLFNTLITAEPVALKEASGRLTRSLVQSGFSFDKEAFLRAYGEATVRYIREAQQDGRETHNSLWISTALGQLGYTLSPQDGRIAAAVDAYFSAFFDHCHLIPGTTEMLGTLKGNYRLGLLSNFTHAPAAKAIIHCLGLTPFFDVVLISGELGYRKPHPFVFEQLIERLGFRKDQILYVGDDLAPDIQGARKAGLQPIWMTYVMDNNLPLIGRQLYRDDEQPDDSIPRISQWNDLFRLLEEKPTDIPCNRLPPRDR